MSGALAERVFAHKLQKVGFTDLAVVERRSFGIDDAARYPLFTPEVIALMHDLLPPERHDQVATAVTLTARKPIDDASTLPDGHGPHRTTTTPVGGMAATRAGGAGHGS